MLAQRLLPLCMRTLLQQNNSYMMQKVVKMSFFDEPEACRCAEIKAQFKHLQKYRSKSLLKKHLSQELFEILLRRSTPVYGATLREIIQSGLDHLDSKIGVYAADADAYNTFCELFDPIIESYHGHKLTQNHPPRNFGTSEQFKQFTNLDPMGDFVKKIIISCSRNLCGYPFTPLMTYNMFQQTEKAIKCIFDKIEDDELSGHYYSYRSLDSAMEKHLAKQLFLFQDKDKYLRTAKAYQCWPIGRGVFVNHSKSFLIWVNEEDHLQLISMDDNGHIGCVYRRLILGLTEIENYLQFQHCDKLGYLTLCPTNLGTALNINIFIRLPNLTKDITKLESLLKTRNLQIGGNHANLGKFNDESVIIISNTQKLGLTEYQIMDAFQMGILEIMYAEVNYRHDI